MFEQRRVWPDHAHVCIFFMHIKVLWHTMENVVSFALSHISDILQLNVVYLQLKMSFLRGHNLQ